MLMDSELIAGVGHNSSRFRFTAPIELVDDAEEAVPTAIEGSACDIVVQCLVKRLDDASNGKADHGLMSPKEISLHTGISHASARKATQILFHRKIILKPRIGLYQADSKKCANYLRSMEFGMSRIKSHHIDERAILRAVYEMGLIKEGDTL